jgi:hypothetical protein
MTGPRQAEIRYRVDPHNVPPEKAARRLHLTLARFNELLPSLIKRGFPEPDSDTGMFDRHRPVEKEPAPFCSKSCLGRAKYATIPAGPTVRGEARWW